MDNPTPINTNSTTTPNGTTPQTEQKTPAPQADTTPVAVGGDLKTEATTDVVKENKDIEAV